MTSFESSQAETIPATVVEEIKLYISGEGPDVLSEEAMGVFLPKIIREIADNPEHVEVKKHLSNPMTGSRRDISFVVVEHDSPRMLTDPGAYRAWRNKISRGGVGGMSTRFDLPAGIDPMHANYAHNIDKGEFQLTDRIFMYFRARISERNDQVLIVSAYNGETGSGIAREFYTDTLPCVAKALGIKYIVGINNEDNITFFTDFVGRRRFVDLNNVGISEIDPHEPYNAYGTVQFLYPEDEERFVN